MEVHHHSHKPKNWKEHITEFIMLFAAVSLGFLAENLREGYVEKERAHEFVTLFKNEIKRNNQTADSVIKLNTPLRNYYDSLMLEFTFNDHIDLDSVSKSFTFWIFRFSNDKRIFDQMKNSGSLRYIKNQVLIDAITNYETEADLAEFRAFTQETNQWEEMCKYFSENLPASFFVRTTNSSAGLNAYGYSLMSKDQISLSNKINEKQSEMTKRIKTFKLPDQVRNSIANKLQRRRGLMALSILNCKRVIDKGNKLIEELDEYLEH